MRRKYDSTFTFYDLKLYKKLLRYQDVAIFNRYVWKVELCRVRVDKLASNTRV